MSAHEGGGETVVEISTNVIKGQVMMSQIKTLPFDFKSYFLFPHKYSQRCGSIMDWTMYQH